MDQLERSDTLILDMSVPTLPFRLASSLAFEHPREGVPVTRVRFVPDWRVANWDKRVSETEVRGLGAVDTETEISFGAVVRMPMARTVYQVHQLLLHRTWFDPLLLPKLDAVREPARDTGWHHGLWLVLTDDGLIHASPVFTGHSEIHLDSDLIAGRFIDLFADLARKGKHFQIQEILFVRSSPWDGPIEASDLSAAANVRRQIGAFTLPIRVIGTPALSPNSVFYKSAPQIRQK